MSQKILGDTFLLTCGVTELLQTSSPSVLLRVEPHVLTFDPELHTIQLQVETVLC